MQIDDELLLKEVIKLCDESSIHVYKEEILNKCGIEDEKDYLQHPLDKDIKESLQAVKQKCSMASEGKEVIELSYAMNDDINNLWKKLIEKSIICLRFFDKREPFMKN